MTSPIGEDDLAAWIDGRLSPERQRLVDAYLEGQPDLHARLREQAESHGVPIVEVTETMAPGASSFQDWQVDQLQAIESALGFS